VNGVYLAQKAIAEKEAPRAIRVNGERKESAAQKVNKGQKAIAGRKG
jgi:hypothetical protein